MPDIQSSSNAAVARERIRLLAGSQIREVADSAGDRDDVIPLWFGEAQAPTPRFIREAAIEALQAGHTTYAPNLGLPALREALSDYASRLHGRPLPVSRIAVTASGVNALMLAAQSLLDRGDRLVMTTPHWPNLREIPHILGASTHAVALRLDGPRWELDLDHLLDALTPGTRALLINSPANPTGWVMERRDQQVVLEHCRRHGIWIIADEVYERLYYQGASAPSFLDIADERDRLIVVNSFSKAWSMTGWRLGWVVAPTTLLGDWAKLTEYNVSCATTFVQHAGVTALREGEPFVRDTVTHYRAARDRVCERLAGLPGVVAPRPLGGFYAFFRVQGETDSLRLAKRLLAETGVGLAPGSAFGHHGEGALRLCFAASLPLLETALDRLAEAL